MIPLYLLDPRFWLVTAAAAGLLFGGGYLMGRSDGVDVTRADQVLEAEAQREARREEISEWVVDVTARYGTLLEDGRRRESAADLINKDLQRKVGSYVTPKADRGCAVPYGAVVYHDAAVPRPAGRPAVPAPAAQLVDGASGIQLSGVMSCVRSNYDAAQSLLDRQAADQRAWREACLAYDRKWGTKSDCARGGAAEAPSNPQGPKGR